MPHFSLNPRLRRGSAMIEFTLAGVAATVLVISTFQLGMVMWNYHTLTMAVHEATRYVAVKGAGCTLPGNTCSVTVGTITAKIASWGIGIPAGGVNITLKTNSGAVTKCTPLNSCFTSPTVWPPSANSDNQPGSLITISAEYHVNPALLFFWPGRQAQSYGSFWLPASSSQQILF